MIETDVATITEMLKGFALGFGLDLLGAVLILVIGWWIAGRTAALVRHSLKNAKFVDSTLKPLAASIARYAVLIFVIIAVLSNFGVETTSIIAVLGAAGLAIGLALQGTLSNIAAGVMILILRPLKVDEFVEAGSVSGTVVEITLFTTLLKTPDGVFISAPNSQIWNSAIKNYSRNPTRRLDIKVGIAYDDDVDAALDFLKNLVASDERVLKDPEPMSFVANLGESSVDLTARGWVATSEFWPTFFDLTRKSKTELEAAGFSIPFPQRDLHVIESAETASIAKPAAKAATKPAAKTAAKKPATRARSTAAKSTTAKKTPATKS
ncbi:MULTISPECIES: mechanosensitive ion channel family protein [unclassified Thalassospira]|jgi:small conductance mechanosensitive channel|uniref:mechanosensitive ion channel family protein n=1 Tax=unclassified Thalassospira TaxID=2648997 RepID=UPI000C5C9FEC|nr:MULTISPECIES: mechanosensitive ion channel domain-containing protein [unclassified Thalassospira]MBC46230.1 mechanosensitive ion channel protein MscS [Thalassospira sp.]MBR9900514.1 mechanosensitive ion channel [Rhodospirillales bacterium]|tara:strand:+ start:6397 stop:7365 length:969 start_codon:yes stop_codon:yes gene_type:complete